MAGPGLRDGRAGYCIGAATRNVPPGMIPPAPWGPGPQVLDAAPSRPEGSEEMAYGSGQFRYPGSHEQTFRGFREGSFRAQDLNLARLEDLEGWTIAAGDPDIRGWNIVNSQDENLGKVETLIASPVTHEVYFLVGQVGGMLGLGGKHILIPVDAVNINRADRSVEVNATKEDLQSAVEWRSDQEVDYLSAYRFWQGRAGMMGTRGERELVGARGGEAPAQTETKVPLREEELVARRETHAGSIEVEKHVETEERTIDVPVSHTEVEIERRTVRETAGMPGGTVAEGETRIPIMEEEVHVEKRPVVKEEIVVRQHPKTEVEHHTETIRREVAEVHTEGDVDVETKGNVDVDETKGVGRRRPGSV